MIFDEQVLKNIKECDESKISEVLKKAKESPYYDMSGVFLYGDKSFEGILKGNSVNYKRKDLALEVIINFWKKYVSKETKELNDFISEEKKEKSKGDSIILQGQSSNSASASTSSTTTSSVTAPVSSLAGPSKLADSDMKAVSENQKRGIDQVDRDDGRGSPDRKKPKPLAKNYPGLTVDIGRNDTGPNNGGWDISQSSGAVTTSMPAPSPRGVLNSSSRTSLALVSMAAPSPRANSSVPSPAAMAGAQSLYRLLAGGSPAQNTRLQTSSPASPAFSIQGSPAQNTRSQTSSPARSNSTTAMFGSPSPSSRPLSPLGRSFGDKSEKHK
jgi:hypothetical protein